MSVKVDAFESYWNGMLGFMLYSERVQHQLEASMVNGKLDSKHLRQFAEAAWNSAIAEAVFKCQNEQDRDAVADLLTAP